MNDQGAVGFGGFFEASFMLVQEMKPELIAVNVLILGGMRDSGILAAAVKFTKSIRTPNMLGLMVLQKPKIRYTK